VSGQRDAAAYLADMIGAMESIISQTAGVDDATVMDPAQPLRGHVLYQLTMLGEAAKHLPAGRQTRRARASTLQERPLRGWLRIPPQLGSPLESILSSWRWRARRPRAGCHA
jgi:uncharacterized protein with HEPN domain